MAYAEISVKSPYIRFFYVLYSDKTRVFAQSEHVQGPTIYILIVNE